jgi:hypothetical protein
MFENTEIWTTNNFMVNFSKSCSRLFVFVQKMLRLLDLNKFSSNTDQPRHKELKMICYHSARQI